MGNDGHPDSRGYHLCLPSRLGARQRTTNPRATIALFWRRSCVYPVNARSSSAINTPSKVFRGPHSQQIVVRKSGDERAVIFRDSSRRSAAGDRVLQERLWL